MIVVTGAPVGTGDALWLGNPARVVKTGIRTWSITNGAAGYLVYMPCPALPGQGWRALVTLTCPTGDPASIFPSILAVSASGTILDRWSADPVLVTSAGASFTIVAGPLPSGTATIRCQVDAATPDGTSRTLTVYANLHRYAAADDLLSARLTRPLNIAALDTPAGPLFTAGTPGSLDGVLQFLHTTLADALTLDSCYQAGPVTLSGGTGMDGWPHQAVDRLQIATERAMPGIPARWVSTVPVKGS